MNKISIIFVCTGNICRSPTAEVIFKSKIDQMGLTVFFQLILLEPMVITLVNHPITGQLELQNLTIIHLKELNQELLISQLIMRMTTLLLWISLI